MAAALRARRRLIRSALRSLTTSDDVTKVAFGGNGGRWDAMYSGGGGEGCCSGPGQGLGMRRTRRGHQDRDQIREERGLHCSITVLPAMSRPAVTWGQWVPGTVLLAQTERASHCRPPQSKGESVHVSRAAFFSSCDRQNGNETMPTPARPVSRDYHRH